MDFEKLSRLLESPETHRRLLSGYDGPYSLGVGRSEESAEKPVVVLHLTRAPAKPIPAQIAFDGEWVRVLVQTDFVQPRALGKAWAAATK